MCAQADFLVFVNLGKGLGVCARFVLYKASYATGVGNEGLEVIFWKSEGEGEEAK